MMTSLVQRYLTSKFHIHQLKRLTVKDLNNLKQQVVQTKLATQQILDALSANRLDGVETGTDTLSLAGVRPVVETGKQSGSEASTRWF